MTKYILNLLHKFSKTGDKCTLQRIYDDISEKCIGMLIVIPPDLALKITIRIAKLIEVDSTNYTYWYCQVFLMNPKLNVCATDYLLLLQNSPILIRLLDILRYNLNTSHNVCELNAYIDLLLQFTCNSYERQTMILNQEGQHVLNAVAHICQNIGLAERFFLVYNCTCLLGSLAYMYPEAIHNNDQRSILWFLNIGGISVLSNMFLIAVNNTDFVGNFLLAIEYNILMVYESLRHLDTTGLDRELYCIQPYAPFKTCRS